MFFKTEEVKAENELNSFALLKKISALNNEKQEFEKNSLFLETQINTLNNKVFNSEKQIKEFEKLKNDFLIEKTSFQYLVDKKKKKIKTLKAERKEILAKIESHLDKESVTKNIITKQSMELDSLYLEGKNLNQNIQILTTEKIELQATIQTLEAEINILRTKNRSPSPEIKNKTNILQRSSDSRKYKKSDAKIILINDSKDKIKSESLYEEVRTALTIHNSEEEKVEGEKGKLIRKNERAITTLQKNRKIQKISSFIKQEDQQDPAKTAPNFLLRSDLLVGEGKNQSELSPLINKEKHNLIKKNSNSKKEESDKNKKNEVEKIDEKISNSSKVNSESDQNRKKEPEKIPEKKSNFPKMIPTIKIIERKSISPNMIDKKVESLDFTEKEKTKLLQILTDLSENPNRMKLLTKFSNILLEIEEKESLTKQKSIEIKKPQISLMKHSISTTNSTQINSAKNDEHYLNELMTLKKSMENNSQREKKSTSITNTERTNSDLFVVHKNTLSEKNKMPKKNMLSLNNDIHSETDDNLSTNSKNKERLHRKLKSENGERVSLFKNMEEQNTNKDSYLRTEYFVEKKKSVPLLSVEKNIFDNLDLNNLTLENQLESISEEQNFAKLKYLYQYPFRSIQTRFKKNNAKNLGQSKNDNQDDFDSFATLFKNLLKSHEKCAFPCEHLKRFYKRIKFVNRYLSKEELTLQKNVIDKLPDVFSTEYF